MRFRNGKIAVCADIAKMYRQILVPVDQRDMQRILWCESKNAPVREYRLKTQTYGMKSAAFVCIRTLYKCASDYEHQYPEAAKTVRTCFYVDDMLKSTDTKQTAISLINELTEMLSKGGFELAKWISNNKEINQIVNKGDNDLIDIDKDQTNAILGLRWNPTKDVFQFKIKHSTSNETLTKRTIVSDIARLYDPMGFLSPIIVIAKILIQRLWKSKLDWDTQIVDDTDNGLHLASDWKSFQNDLINIEKINIPRWINTDSSCKIELHGFSDASEDAFGVAFYIRSESSESSTKIVKTNLVFSKTRVAPVAKATVPKLELSAAHLMSKLLPKVTEAHNVDIGNCFLWCDSMIALHWISKSPSKLETFQANRVAEIQELTEGATWQHIVTKDNPADLASRGVLPHKLAFSQLWWNGPPWLSSPKNEWPVSHAKITNKELEIMTSAIKKTKPIIARASISVDEPLTVATPRTSESDVEIEGLLTKTTDWSKLLTITSYVKRFISKQRPRSFQPNAEERWIAECIWVKYSQQLHFDKEIRCCQAGKSIDKTSSIHKLAPFIDKE